MRYDVAIGEPRWTQTYRVEESTWETTGKSLADFLGVQFSGMNQRLAADPDLVTDGRAAASAPTIPIPVITTPTAVPQAARSSSRTAEPEGARGHPAAADRRREYQTTRERILESL